MSEVKELKNHSKYLEFILNHPDFLKDMDNSCMGAINQKKPIFFCGYGNYGSDIQISSDQFNKFTDLFTDVKFLNTPTSECREELIKNVKSILNLKDV